MAENFQTIKTFSDAKHIRRPFFRRRGVLSFKIKLDFVLLKAKVHGRKSKVILQECDDDDDDCKENKNDLILLAMIMESKTRGISMNEILPLLYRDDPDHYELMFFIMMLNERQQLCEVKRVSHR